MPTRAQRRRNQQARETAERIELHKAALPDFAETKLGTSKPGFFAEVAKSEGVASVTFRPWGRSNYVNVYGSPIDFNETLELRGDGLVSDWPLPDMQGFQVRFAPGTVMIARLEPAFGALDVSDVWLKTADELAPAPLTVAQQGSEKRIVVSREGLAHLSQNMGHQALGQSLGYIEAQLFS